MKNIDEATRVYVWLGSVDMRCSFDRLSSFIESEFKRSVPEGGGLYVFFSKCKRRVKILYWDSDGLALWYKRLEAGVFRVKRIDTGVEQQQKEELTGVDLGKLLSGIDLSRIKMQKRVHKALS